MVLPGARDRRPRHFFLYFYNKRQNENTHTKTPFKYCPSYRLFISLGYKNFGALSIYLKLTSVSNLNFAFKFVFLLFSASTEVPSTEVQGSVQN